MIRYRLAVHRAAKDDLTSISRTDSESAGILLALLEQIAVDPRLLESLSIRGYGAHQTAVVHVDKWVEQQRLGRNLWRLKH